MKLVVDFVCADCAVKAGGKLPPNHQPTWHLDHCDVCKEVKPVTQPRDFGHPNFEA